jgi:YHS domain-containing protein
MRVDRLKALRSDYMGGAYYFCSSGCREAFESEPEKYLGASRVPTATGQLSEG